MITFIFRSDLKFKYFFFFLLSIISYNGIAQTSTYVDNSNYSPTNPEVSSLGKFIETPVGLYTGVPEISIPITSIQEGKINIPISLRYHAGGIKVEETSSWVGNSWNLSAGGSVTRIVRGIADDADGGYISTSNTVEEFLSKVNIPQYKSYVDHLIQSSLEGNLDYENDIFHYSFGEFSGGFFMDQNGSIIPMPHTDIKIEYQLDASNKIKGWIITAPNGEKAYFGISEDLQRTGYEQVKSISSNAGRRNRTIGYTTEWKLMDHKDYNNNGVQFFYDNIVHYSSCSRSGQQKFINVEGQQDPFTGELIINPGLQPITYYGTQLYSARISKILSLGKEITFHRNSVQRLDMPGDFSLSQIRTFDRKENKEESKFVFEYEFNRSLQGSTSTFCSDSESEYRLFLKSITEFSGGEEIPPYKFFYDNTSLPSKFSFAQDFWGYYNGATNNENLIPTLKVRDHVFEGAQRYSNENYMKAGILNKITYPTGGSTKFYYEGNTTNNLSPILRLIEKQQINLVGVSNYNLDQNNVHQISEFFQMPANLFENQVYIDVSFPCDVTQRTCEINFKLRDSNGLNITITQDFNYELEPGIVYELVGSVADDDYGNPPDFSIRIYGEEIIEDTGEALVGGLRVKKIQYLNQNDLIVKEKNYTYHLGSFVNSPPVYIELGAFFSIDQSLAVADIISSSSLNPMTSTKGSYVGYQKVIEYFGNENLNQGKKEYTFSFATNDDQGSQIFPYVPDVNLEWLRGKLIKEQDFLLAGGSYDTISEQRNSYRFYRNIGDIYKKNVTSLKFAKRGTDFYIYEPYLTTSEWFQMEEIFNKIYFPETNVIEKKSFSYHETEGKHVFPISESMKLSNEDIETIKTYYVSDVENPTAAQILLNNKFRISEIVKQEKILNQSSGLSEVLSTNEKSFKIWFPNIVAPEFIKTSKSNDGLKEEIIFLSYDEKGNPLELLQPEGVLVTYLWGYEGKHPVAKIVNASYDQVSNLVNLITINEINTSDSLMQSELDKIRTGLPHSSVTTYTYDLTSGVTSIKDPKGIISTFHYDKFNRLELVKDSDGNILKEHKYKYRLNP